MGNGRLPPKPAAPPHAIPSAQTAARLARVAGEVGIIVLGVLIALAAQSMVKDWQWRQKVVVVR
jgi:hypothetical protein